MDGLLVPGMATPGHSWWVASGPCFEEAARRGAARLLAEVTEFMTLEAGDLLLVGVPEGAPRVRAGDRVAIEIDGLGRLENPVEREGAAA